MTTKYGVNSTLVYNGDPTNKKMPAQGDWGGSPRWMNDKYVIAAGVANGDIVVLGRLLAGQKMGELIVETPDGLGAGCTLKVGTQNADGTADDDDRFITATAFANANTKLSINAPGTGRQYQADVDKLIIATIGGADPTAGRTIISTGTVVAF